MAPQSHRRGSGAPGRPLRGNTSSSRASRGAARHASATARKISTSTAASASPTTAGATGATTKPKATSNAVANSSNDTDSKSKTHPNQKSKGQRQHPAEPPRQPFSPHYQPQTQEREEDKEPLPLNVRNVIFNNRLITPWFPSLYREELVSGEPVERLWVCSRCFRYTKELVLGCGHFRFCEFRDSVPGRIVYNKGRYSIYELDGEEYQLFTQNLSLFSKLFIENKSVCFDVSTFLYYLLVDNTPSIPHSPSPKKSSSTGKVTKKQPSPKAAKAAKAKSDSGTPPAPPQIVGFFSKEKLSWDNNNLACILVFPPWQRLGLGQMLMGASYELARREGRLGGPERPLSALGKKSYVTYWSRSVAGALLALPNKARVTMQQLSEATYIIADDVVTALLEMEGVLGTAYKSKADGEERVRLDKGMVRSWLARSNGGDASAKPSIDLDGFVAEDGDSADGAAAGGALERTEWEEAEMNAG